MELNINTYFGVIGCMICVIIHICKYTSNHSDGDHRKNVSIVIKILFYVLSSDEFHFTLDLFWTDYNDCDNKNGPFGGD